MAVGRRKLKRLLIIALFTFTLFSILICQFFHIQIIDGDHWSNVAKKQHFFSVNEPFVRGTFWSNPSVRVGHPDQAQRFVLDIQKFHLFADPLSIPEELRDPTCEKLFESLNTTPNEKHLIRDQFDKKSRSRKLKMWLDRDTKDVILAWWNGFAKKHKIARNALYFVSEYQRSYPFGKLLGQVLHTVQSQRDEITKQAFPTGGLELFFDSYLKGSQGKRILKRSPRHSFETGQVLFAPEDGADVFLTINHYLQAIAEEEVEKGVKRCRAKSGWAVMMEPNTGEILALAQYPFFYPSQYNDYFNDPELIEHTKVKAVTDANEPGSVVKAITTAIALLANKELIKRGEPPIFDPEEKMPTSDGHFPGRRKLLTDITHHNYMNMNMALQKSSNIYPARLVEKIIGRLGTEWYRNVLEEKFGFGVKTDIELPSESPGLLPRLGKKHPNGTLEWSTPTPFSLAIGHNLQLNSIQVVRAFATLANGGFLVKPTIVKKITKKLPDGTEKTLLDHTKLPSSDPFPRVLSSDIVKTVVKGVKYATKPGGSGRRADILGYTEVGKTGTANKIIDGTYSEAKSVSSFIGFAPAENPAFVLLVVMDEPERRYIPGVGYNHRGSVSSAPVFKAIGTRALEYLGVTLDDPNGYPFGDPRYDRDLADWLPETRQLREIYEKWNN